MEGAFEDYRQIDRRGFIFHPLVRARSVHVNIRAQIGQHHRFAKHSRAEMRNNEFCFRELRRDPVNFQRVRPAHIEKARQSELLARSHGKRAAMNQHCCSRPLARKRGNGADALVFSHRVMMHRREQTDDAQSQIVECASRARFGVRLCRIEHKRACDPIRERRYGCGDRLFVARRAGDHQSSGDAVTVEFRRPDRRQLRRVARRHCPAGHLGGAFDGVRLFAEMRRLPCERLEKFVGEEMRVSVEYFKIAERSGLFQRSYLLCKILYSDSVIMPTIFTHGAIGFTAMRSVFTAPTDHGLTLASILLPILPDADALLMPWIPYGHPFGHRGFTHSLFFAALVGLVTAALALRGKWASDHSFPKLAIFFTLITASHGLFDAMT